MRIGILETGLPPRSLRTGHGRYDAMVRAMLGGGHEYRSYVTFEGELPPGPAAEQAYVLTGSSASVYDREPWMEGLTGFLREAAGRAKLVGICFGHQLMAQAFGGRVEKAAVGWGIGAQDYLVAARADWMDEDVEPGATRIAVPVSHQDQVTVKPPAARVLAANDFTPHGILAWDDQPAISLQCHPEFSARFARDLACCFDEGDPLRQEALKSLERPTDNARLAGWISRFLET